MSALESIFAYVPKGETKLEEIAACVCWKPMPSLAALA